MSDEPKQADGPEAPAPETLQAQASDTPANSDVDANVSGGAEGAPAPNAVETKPRRRLNYRPSHKATFIGLGVVSAILLVNVVIVLFVIKGQADTAAEIQANSVTLSPAVLDKLGVSRNPVGNSQTELTIGPKATFNKDITVAGNATIAGQLNLNGTFQATDAKFTNLQAGDTQVDDLNVNGDATISTLNLRNDLQVAGDSRLQGKLTVGNLATFNNTVNVVGNLAVGGQLSVGKFQISKLVISSHILTTGSTPTISRGGAVGSGGTVSISGSDAAGTINVNIGTGASSGLLAVVNFAEKYDSTPHVVFSPVGRAAPNVYVNRTTTGFTLSTSSALSIASYSFDYVIVQ